jgi:hypothetical protein
MPTYNVSMKTTVYLNVRVEAEDEEAALDKADELAGGGLTLFVGNGGVDKMCGTTESAVSLSPDEYAEFNGEPELLDE